MSKLSCSNFCIAFSIPGGPEIKNTELFKSAGIKY
jgi:hypothetical protein